MCPFLRSFPILFGSLILLHTYVCISTYAISVCDGKVKYEQCLPKPDQILDMIFPFAMRVTEGTWKEGGTIYASMCMFQNSSDKCYTVTTDVHDVSLMHREAGFQDVLWENALLVPCKIPQEEANEKDWYFKVTDHANYMLDQTWINTTNIFGPFQIIPAPCGLFNDPLQRVFKID